MSDGEGTDRPTGRSGAAFLVFMGVAVGVILGKAVFAGLGTAETVVGVIYWTVVVITIMKWDDE